MENENISSPEVANVQEERLETTLRPQTLDEYIGQTKVKESMKIYIEAAKKRNEPLDHCLFYGPPGLGKTTISGIIANEMHSKIRITSGPAIEKPGDLAGILTSLEEYDVLFKNDTLNKYVLDNKKEITSDLEFRVPRLVNYTPDKKYSSLIENMKSVDKSILGKISEISYQPNEFDKDRFLLLMDDGNSVYLTLTKFEMINYYNEVLGQLEGRRGILYLDSGNHFKIME